ncbi:phage integrase [Legionella shakespearei DSM 23087]|uniref:Phage integrase n=1 Tax=Legionella shakespearei DSM 23087 TaxID=1122169 RepID=A0A0W0Z2T8_9GAMM|nr:phage integrase [Legionella shakespearei DSM 23087]
MVIQSFADSLDLPAYALKRLLNHKMNNDVTAGYIMKDVERLRKPMQQVANFLQEHMTEVIELIEHWKHISPVIREPQNADE